MLKERHKEFLAGKYGKAAQISMKILRSLARIFDARDFSPVSSAQISGISYLNLSDSGLEFIEEVAKDGHVVVPSMLNPAGMDLVNWKEMGIDENFATKQMRIINAFMKMGAEPTCTCTPYLTGYIPKQDEILAWGESSAVTYINSVIGARSNRVGGPAAIASAIIGETPVYGLHLDCNRMPEIVVTLKTKLKSPHEYGAIAVLLGQKQPGKIPLIVSDFEPTDSGLRALSAGLPTYSGVSLFHWKDFTPNPYQIPQYAEEINLGSGDLKLILSRWSEIKSKPQMVFLGCPHLSIDDLEYVKNLLQGKNVKTILWLCTSRSVFESAKKKGVAQELKNLGATIVCDTCPVVAPLPSGVHRIATDSFKGCYYLEGNRGVQVTVASMEECLKIATE